MSLEALYRDIAVIAPQEYYVRPGHTTAYHTPANRHAHEDPLMAQILRFEQDSIAWVDTPEARLAIVDKASPHVVTEAMIAVFGLKNNVLSFSDATHNVGRQILKWMHGYVQFATGVTTTEQFGTHESFIRIGINIDHETSDRGSLQGVRLLHPHCITFPTIPEGERAMMPLDFSRPNGEIASIIDPLAKLGPAILQEHFKAGVFSDSVYAHFSEAAPDEPGMMPLAFNLRMKHSWDTLLSDTATIALADLDATMNNVYKRIRSAVVNEDTLPIDPWQRYTLRPPETREQNIATLPVLSEKTKSDLMALVSILRNVDPRKMTLLKNARAAGAVSIAERFLSYRGLAYSLCLYSPGTVTDIQLQSNTMPAYIAVQPFLRRSSGTAGVNVDAEGCLFKVDRQAAVKILTPGEEQKRRMYHAAFAQHIGL